MLRTVTAGLTLTVLLTWHLFALPLTGAEGPPPLHVEGTKVKTPDGEVVRLQGLNVPGLEWGPGEHLLDSVDAAVGDWGANAIRLPLAQDRWFGHTPERKDGGASYRRTVRDFVQKAAARNCYVILDLHWSNTGRWGEFIGQHQMPDDHSAAFWADAAAAYANHPAVLLGLYNEPYGVSWEVWRNGGAVGEKNPKAADGKLDYHTPGMQKLLDVCRANGARNVVVVGGLDWGYELSGISKGFPLHDPEGNGVVYDTHIYPWKKDWDRWVTPTARKYPVLVGEIGIGKAGPQHDPRTWLPRALTYIDRHELHWTAWCLHPGAQPNLIVDWTYRPTEPFGVLVKKALREAGNR
jgi:aryl-phospho-beta-D-glucosidase BglC (GH1 family)